MSNKIDELNQIKNMFSQNQLNDLIIDWLKEINQLQNITKINELDYKTISGKNYIFSKYSLFIHC